MSSQSSSANTSTASSKFARGNVGGKNPLWGYVTVVTSKKDGNGNASWTCNYCNQTHSGSYSRVKGHLLRNVWKK